ncbi:MAG: outer membrane protein assembly factor BamB family protein [Nitrososphaerales archaeon]
MISKRRALTSLAAVFVFLAIVAAAYYNSTIGADTISSTHQASTSVPLDSSSRAAIYSSTSSKTETSTAIAYASTFSSFSIATSLSNSSTFTRTGSPATGEKVSSSWPTYHGDLSRDGASTSGTFHNASLSWQSVTLDGAMYAEPLILNGSVFVATEDDSVYSLNDTTGSILWRTNLGQPVPLSSLPCGDINPLGITGTPAIDVQAGVIFVAAFIEPGTHILFALRVSDGALLWNSTLDPPGMNVMYQQQRGALAIADGYVYVPFGGLAGDCGTYQGWVIGLPENDSGGLISFRVPTASGGAIWGTSGIAFDNSTNELFVTTGNSASNSEFDFGESVIALTPSLKEIDYFAPTNWVTLNAGDTDLGSVGPTIIGNNTIFQIGKQGFGYLLNLTHLGGVGGELFSAQVCNDDAAFGGVSYQAPYLYVPCRTDLVALYVNLTSSSFKSLWSMPEGFAGPPITAGGATWNLDVNNGTLFAYNMTTGSVLFRFQVGGMGHFETPSAGDGQIFVAANDSVEAFAVH